MSARAIVIGLLAAAFLAGFGHFNDEYMMLTRLVGNYLPISVFGLLIVVVLLVNPVLYRMHRSWRLRPAELAVVTAFALVGCAIPGAGFLRNFTPTLVMPIHRNQSDPGWQRAEVLSYVPERMLPAGGQMDPAVVDNYLAGMRVGQQNISLYDVPWQGWQQPLAVWLPMLMLLAVAVITLSMIVHRQWSHHERLRYPIAAFTNSLLEQDDKHAMGSIFRNRLFWIGFAVVLTIRLVNGYGAWNTQSIQVPLMFDFSPIGSRLPDIFKAPFGWSILRPQLYPTVIAFAFFLASDVGLSLGISNVVGVLVGLAFVTAGVNIAGTDMEGGLPQWQRFGSFLGIAILLGYTGRRYYWQVVKRALTFRASSDAEPWAAWACRGFLAACAGLVWMLMDLGLEAPLAILTVLLLLLMFLVMARLTAEGGLFWIQPYWGPIAVMVGLFGYEALGPQGLMILALFTVVMAVDPREALMPFIINGLKIADDQKVRPSRVGWGAIGVFALALAVAVPLALWFNYNYGRPPRDAGGSNPMCEQPYNLAVKSINHLTASDQLEASIAIDEGPGGGWRRLLAADPDPRFLAATGVGLALVIGFSWARLRFPWWPIHPILFLVWGSYPMAVFATSFLLGWAAKVAITRITGGQGFQRAKPLMVGVIAGDLLGGLIFMIIGAIYYASTGTAPKDYQVFPI